MNDVPPRLIYRQGPGDEQAFDLIQEKTVVGRDKACDIAIPDPEISRQHAQFMRQGDSVTIVDLGSTNGTFVNGQRVSGPTPLKNGDIIELGEAVRLDFTSAAPAADATIAEPYSETAEMETVIEPDWGTDHLGPEDTFGQLPDAEPGRRRWLLGCGCGFLLLVFLCAALLFFLDAYEGGRLLYCGPLEPLFQSILGPFGFSPACALP